MKYIYKTFFIVFIPAVFGLLIAQKGYTQCPGGQPEPGPTAYDTTVSTGSGNYEAFFSFPKFDPQNGTLSCMRLTMIMTGVVNMFLENNVTSATTYNINYNRRDTVSGPGLSTPMSNNANVNYGPYNLAASNGTPFSGPDFTSIGPDTVLNAVTVVRTITDSATLDQFYGTDSVTYRYAINVNSSVTGSGDYLFSVGTTGFITFRIEYCYCPPLILPSSLFSLKAVKQTEMTADLSWKKPALQNENYIFQVEVSPDGRRFYTEASIDKNAMDVDGQYHFRYTPASLQQSNYYFRIRIKYADGSYRLSQVKSLQLGTRKSSFTVFPNPSDGIVGIKFDDVNATTMNIQIININGQTVYNEKLQVNGPAYRQITRLSTGTYWLRLSDVTGQLSGVNQLLIIK